MPQADYLFPMPQLPNTATAPSYGAIMDILKTPTPTMSQFLPELEGILSGRSQFLKPQVDLFNEQLGSILADFQGDFNKRGLAGSSIEAQGLATARGQGLQSLASMLGDFSMQGATTFADMLFKARQGDVEASRSVIEAIAQLMGDQMAVQNDNEQASKARRAGLIGAGIGATGSIIGGRLSRPKPV